MSLIASVRIAALAAAVLVAGAFAASAATEAAKAPAAAGVIVALNPQPLPPIIEPDYDDFFRG